MSTKSRWILPLGLLFVACATGGLEPLVLQGPDLHRSLVTRQIPGLTRLHVPCAVLQGNPTLSTDPAFVEATARSGSQG